MGTASSVGKQIPSVCSIVPPPTASTNISASRAQEVRHTEVVAMTLFRSSPAALAPTLLLLLRPPPEPRPAQP